MSGSSKKKITLRYWSWIIRAVIIIFVAAIRIRLLQIQLRPDEGEFAISE
jgi:hypothetical protein